MLVKFITSIFIRLLYGKMQRWTGTGTGGKAGIGVRRAVVLRFLASCPQREIQIFMDLILAPFIHLCTGTCLDAIKSASRLSIFQFSNLYYKIPCCWIVFCVLLNKFLICLKNSSLFILIVYMLQLNFLLGSNAISPCFGVW